MGSPCTQDSPPWSFQLVATSVIVKAANRVIIPVLFYTGRRSPYPYSARWLHGFDNPESADKLYSGDFPLVDVTVIPDDEMMTHRSMVTLTLLQKHIHQHDIATLTDQLARLLMEDTLSSPLVM